MTANDRPHLLLLPGLLNDARLWERQIADLAAVADCSVADLTVSDTVAGLAAAVLTAAPVQRFALAGLSMGGYVALEIMRQDPGRVLALALLDTSARPDAPEAQDSRRALMELAETDFTAVVEALLPKMVHPSRMDDAAVVGTIRAMAADAGKGVFGRQQRAILGRPDSRPNLHEIRCPTLVLCGRQDVVTTLDVHQELVDAIAHAGFTVLDECGHLSPLGQPRLVSEALRIWLAKIVR